MSEIPTFTTNTYDSELSATNDREQLGGAHTQTKIDIGGRALGAATGNIDYKPRHAKPEEIEPNTSDSKEDAGDTRELAPPAIRENMTTLRKIQRQVMENRGNPLAKLPHEQSRAMQQQLDMVLGFLHSSGAGDLATAKRALGFSPGHTPVNEIQARLRSAIADIDSKYKF
ncbi:hypothetical protein KC949_01760 [Candidatus Saccharibacteria bacterium]|nr:hypothetical protein [Candidatus Saccharibacteria bacterium]